MEKLEKRLTIHQKKSESMVIWKQKTLWQLSENVNVKTTRDVIYLK